MIPIWTGKVVEAGLLLLDRPHDYNRYVKSLAGLKVDVQIRKRKERRSTKANSFYWSVIVPAIAEASGMTNEEAHDALKFHFLQEPGDGPLRKIRSTASLSVEEFSAYTERCQALGCDYFGIEWEE